MKRSCFSDIEGSGEINDDEPTEMRKEQIKNEIENNHYEELQETEHNPYQTIQKIPDEHKTNTSNTYECNMDCLEDPYEGYETMSPKNIVGHDNESYVNCENDYLSLKPDYDTCRP